MKLSIKQFILATAFFLSAALFCGQPQGLQSAYRQREPATMEALTTNSWFPVSDGPDFAHLEFSGNNPKDFSYQYANISGSASMKGTVITLQYPTYLGKGTYNGVSSQEWADKVFQGKSSIQLYYDTAYLSERYKTVIYLNNVPYYNIWTSRISEGDTYLSDGEEIVKVDSACTAISLAQLYTDHNQNASKAYVNYSWSKMVSSPFGVVTVLDKTGNSFLYHGFRTYKEGRTYDKYTVNGKTDYWYKISINGTNAWVFGADLEPCSYDSQDYSQMLQVAQNRNYISITEDTSLSNKDVKHISLGEEDEAELYYDDENVYIVYPYKKQWAKTDRSALAVDTDGFLKLTFGQETFLIIDGKRISQYFTDFQNDGTIKYNTNEDSGGYYNFNVKSVTSSSYYSETIRGNRINYTADNLFKCFMEGCRCHPYWWNNTHIPWVEGAEGDGIGETITVEFKEPITSLSILNGYTDLNKLKLYKENSRLKKIKVEDLTNGTEQIIDFEDYVYFNLVQFEQTTSKIRVTILETYNGSKYTDTCVSAFVYHTWEPSESTIIRDLTKTIYDFQEITFQEAAEMYNSYNLFWW